MAGAEPVDGSLLEAEMISPECNSPAGISELIDTASFSDRGIGVLFMGAIYIMAEWLAKFSI